MSDLDNETLPHVRGQIAAGVPEAFDTWRAMIAPMFDFDTPSPNQRADFTADFELFDFGTVQLGFNNTSASNFERNNRIVARTGTDHFMVQFYQNSDYLLTANGNETAVTAGDVTVLDLTRSVSIRAPAVSNLSVIVSRDLIAPLIANPDNAHGRVLRKGTDANFLVRSQLTMQMSQARHAMRHDAPSYSRSTAELIAGVLGSSTDGQTATRAAMRKALLEAICRRVDAQLGNPDLGPEFLMKQFHLSRATLYRLFEPLGGIAKYIQERRLWHAFRDLCEPSHAHERVSTILYRWGFTDHTAAGRTFRAFYQMTPSAVRNEALDLRDTALAITGREAKPFQVPKCWPSVARYRAERDRTQR